MSDGDESLRQRLLRRRLVMETTLESDSSLPHSFTSTPSTSRIMTVEASTSEIRDEVEEVRPQSPTVKPVDANSDLKHKKFDKLREKLRQKLQLAKQAAGKQRSLLEDATKETVDLENHSVDSREYTLDEYDDSAVLEQLRQHSISMKATHDVAEASGKESFPTTEEAYDFFTCTWEEDMRTPPSSGAISPARASSHIGTPGGKGSSATPIRVQGHDNLLVSPEPLPSTSSQQDEIPFAGNEEPAQVSSDAENGKLLVNDLIQIKDGWQPVRFQAAVYEPFRERLEKEKEKYFIPSTAKVPTQEKLPETMVPRNLADEGFYVGKPPRVRPSNRNKMEHRLLKNKELQWFGEDGEIVALPDAIDENPPRPQIDELDALPIKTEFKKARYVELSTLLDNAEIPGSYQLDVNIGQVTFTHHHLFSREHVIASHLMSLHRQYSKRQETSSVELLTKKLDVLRSAVASVQEAAQLALEEDDANAKNSRVQRLQMYRREIRLLRQRLHREEQADRTLLKRILWAWKTLKALRESQRHVTTTLQLKIIKKNVNRETDLEIWERTINAEVDEEREDHEARHYEAMKDYKQKLKAYRRTKSKRKKRRSHGKAKENDDEESLYGERQDDAEEEEVMTAPDLPPPFDEETMRERIRQNALEIRRHPGEPVFYPELSHSGTITSPELCSKREQKRRIDVSRCKLYAKIFYNDKEVTKTATQSLGQNFSLTINEIFHLCISQYPRSITLQMYETQGLSTSLLMEMFLPIPSSSDDISAHANFEQHDFSSEQAVTYSHEGIGSGVNFTFDMDSTNVPVTLLTSGLVHCSVTWAKNQDKRLLPSNKMSQPPFLKNDPISALGAKNITDPEKLKQWIESSDLDPNDPANALLMKCVKDGVLSLTKKEYFRLNQLQNEFSFTQTDDFFLSRRFFLIQQRDQGIPEFRNFRMIPMREQDISPDVFKAYEKRLKDEHLPPDQMDEDVDSYRKKVTQYLNKVREEVWKRYQLTQHRKELTDLVSEEQIPDIGTLGSTLVNLAERKRPLRPIRKERKKVTAQNVGGAAVSILVNVASAFNVPVRKESERTSRMPRQLTTTNAVTTQEPLVQPLVEVTFQQSMVHTTVSSGPNPCWNQDLQLEFRAPSEDFTPSNLQSVKDVLYFNLFDEVVVDLLEDERDRDSLIHQRIEKRWLGSLQIPFSTLYLNTRVEGTFQVTRQPILLGYTQDSAIRKADLLGTEFGSSSMEKEHTYLSVFITLEPTLPLPEPLKEKFESCESEKLVQRVDAYKTAFSASFPKRQMKALVINIQGKSVFVTRFLQSLAPPEELCDSAAVDSMRRVARFVSLIPIISDIVVFPGLCDIWTTSDQFLNMLVGDQEEHAILLCNYFLFLKKNAWLLLGFAIPEGRTIYVLTENGNEFTMWNACTGESFSVHDSFCPVQSVGCIVNQDNIWANVQHSCEPSRMSFDLKNTKHWRPFFDNSFRNPGLASIQPEAILYRKTEEAFVEKLREKIERTLRNQMMQWRKRFRTSWNRHSSQVLRRILQKMESSKFGICNEDEIQAELQTILGVYKMCGFPLSMPYTEMTAILDTVYATGVYLTEGPHLEFALAVHVHPYPHNVVAVWIYVASLHKR